MMTRGMLANDDEWNVWRMLANDGEWNVGK